MSIFACDCCPNVTQNFGCYNFALEKQLFSDRLALIFSVVKKHFVVLRFFFAYFHAEGFQILRKSTHGH